MIWTAIIIALCFPMGRTGGFMIVSHAVLWGYRKSVVHYWKITIIHHAFLILFFLYEVFVCWRCLTLPQPHDCSTISAVKLSYRDRNGTGRTLDAKTTNTNPFNNNHPYGVCCVKHCTTNTNTTIISSLLRHIYIILGVINCFLSPTHKSVFFCVGVLVPVTLQHVTMLTALAYQPHHLQGTSTETSSQNRLPA